MVTKINEKINSVAYDFKYTKVNNLNINRKFIKRGIMTIPYGATIRGIINQLKSQFFEYVGLIDKRVSYKLTYNNYNKSVVDIYLSFSELSYLSTIIHDILYDTFPILRELVTF
jgi:hypothetical protein